MDSVSLLFFCYERQRVETHREVETHIHRERDREIHIHTETKTETDHTKITQACTIESQVSLPREPSCQLLFCLFKNFVIETITDVADGTKYFF